LQYKILILNNMGFLNGLRFGQYWGFGGVEIPMVNMVDMVAKLPQKQASKAPEEKEFSVKGLYNSSLQLGALYYTGKNDILVGKEKMRQGENMKLYEQEGADELIQEGQEQMIRGYNTVQKVDIAKTQVERVATEFDKFTSTYANTMSSVSVKNGLPYYLAMSDDETLANTSARSAIAGFKNQTNQAVITDLDYNKNYIDDKGYYYQSVFDTQLFPDTWKTGTDYTKKLQSVYQAIGSNRNSQAAYTHSYYLDSDVEHENVINASIMDIGAGMTLLQSGTNTVASNHQQLAELLSTSDIGKYMDDQDFNQMTSDAASVLSYGRWGNMSFSNVFTNTEEGVKFATETIETYRKLGFDATKRKGPEAPVKKEGETDAQFKARQDSYEESKKMDVYDFDFNSDYLYYKTDENGNFLDEDGNITTDKTKYVEASALEKRPLIASFPNTYLMSQINKMHDAELEQLFDINSFVSLNRPSNTYVNVNNAPQVLEQYGLNMFVAHAVYQGSLRTPERFSMATRTIGGQLTPASFDSPTTMIDVQGDSSLQSLIGVQAYGSSRVYVRDSQGNGGYALIDNALTEWKFYGTSGVSNILPKIFTRREAVSYSANSFYAAMKGEHKAQFTTPITETRPDGQTITYKNVGEYLFSQNPSDSDIHSWATSPSRKNELLYTKDGYANMRQRIEILHNSSSIDNLDYQKLLNIFDPNDIQLYMTGKQITVMNESSYYDFINNYMRTKLSSKRITDNNGNVKAMFSDEDVDDIISDMMMGYSSKIQYAENPNGTFNYSAVHMNTMSTTKSKRAKNIYGSEAKIGMPGWENDNWNKLVFKAGDDPLAMNKNYHKPVLNVYLGQSFGPTSTNGINTTQQVYDNIKNLNMIVIDGGSTWKDNQITIKQLVDNGYITEAQVMERIKNVYATTTTGMSAPTMTDRSLADVFIWLESTAKSKPIGLVSPYISSSQYKTLTNSTSTSNPDEDRSMLYMYAAGERDISRDVAHNGVKAKYAKNFNIGNALFNNEQIQFLNAIGARVLTLE
jgi:hypothetical protein